MLADILAYVGVALLGGAVGWTELAGRYRDHPTGPLRTWPGAIHIAVNVAASLVAPWIVRSAKLAETTTPPAALSQVMVAGIGAMAFFRSAIFNVRAGQTYDRLRAGQSSAAATQIMQGVPFDRAKGALGT